MAAAAPVSPRSASAKREREARIGVTVLSGFLGSGKTTLLSRLLNESHGKRLAVIVNDMSELNLDARAASKLVQAEQKLVAMQNGCICCTLREDLLEEVAKLARSGKFDYLVIESTGIAEPLPVAETFSFDSEGASLSDLARLDTMVTMVDAHSFLHDLDTLESLDDRGWEEEQEDAEQHVSTLLVEQIEFANVVVINKCDLVSEAEAARVEAAVRGLNPEAKVIRATKAAVPLDAVMNTGLFSMEKASTAAGWLKEARGEHVPETVEYGISSFVFRSKRPFHPGRLGLLLESRAFSSGTSSQAPPRRRAGADGKALPPAAASDAEGEAKARDVDDDDEDNAALMAKAASEPLALQAAMRGEYGFVIRSKGIAWLAGSEAGSNSFAGEWSHSGRRVSLTPTGQWMASVPEADRPKDEEFVRSWSDEPGVGDRCNEVVIIAFDLKVDEFRAALQACQVTDAEWEAGPTSWAKIEDPIWGDVDWEAFIEAMTADDDDDEEGGAAGHHHHHDHGACSLPVAGGEDREPESKRAASSSPVGDSA
ncbi:hypothetical protein FNF27_05981 [Cafeteria roenbergensis]|uniref:CobW C-terminal domain-containing protein n=1 Tax=Cafeteria roenbergensis TaxID=33653 RepID=A0A5A8E3Z5_CAFRO|nr:hypothetical protein FNF27_05981 [Cafeteria roenbergensis]